MNEIKEEILTCILAEEMLPDSLRKKIESSEDLRSYYLEMKELAEYSFPGETSFPEQSFFDRQIKNFEEGVQPSFSIYKNLLRVAALLIVFITGYYLGNKEPGEELGDYNRILTQSNILLTSIINADNHSEEVLDYLVYKSSVLLKKISELKGDLEKGHMLNTLSEIERIFILLGSLKGKVNLDIKELQYKIDRRKIINKIETARI